ncbi:hypothetical protein JCM19992_10210 [Thermostilla marina]
MASWYYAKNQQRFGPVSEEEIRRMVADGTLSGTDLVWREGMPQWQPVASFSFTPERPTGAAPFAAGPPRFAEGKTPAEDAAGGDVEGHGSTRSPAPEQTASKKSSGLGDVSWNGVGEKELPIVRRMHEVFEQLTTQIRRLFVGQDELVVGTLTALFSGGHVLIESVPGLGKTLFVRTLGRVLGCRFARIQFTADLMPSDITGAPVFNMKTQEFEFRPGPVFTNILLADEINRSPAKTHAALLEVMQEYCVTVEGRTHRLDRPFVVLATQNPIESEGTYSLPEAQLDRFMLKLAIEYPDEAEEARILMMHGVREELDKRLESLEVVTSPEEIVSLTEAIGEVFVDAKLVDYINTLVRKTRNWPTIYMGASPRAGLALLQGAKTLAAFRGRSFVVPDDVVDLALPALRHRVILTPEAEVEGYSTDEVLNRLIQSVEVPRL